MPEKWQREIEKLRQVEPAPTVRRRIGEGPHGDGMPPAPRRGQRIAAGVVAFAVFGGAIALAWGAFGRAATSTTPGTVDDHAVTIELRGSPTPTASLGYGGTTIKPKVASYCWSSESSMMCADTVVEPFDDGAFVRIPIGSGVLLTGDAQSATMQLKPGSDPLGRAPSASLEGSFERAGRFVLVVDASWPEGDVTFFFPVDVVERSSSPASNDLVATLDAPPGGSLPTLTLTYEGTTEEFFAQAGSWPGVQGFDQPLRVFSAPVMAGTALRVGGDARSWVVDIKRDGDADSRDVDSSTILGSTGMYLLTFKGVWDEGTLGFLVQVVVTDGSTSPPSPTSTVSPEPSASEAGSVSVPDLVGMGDQAAIATLHELGLTPIVAYRGIVGERWHVASMDPEPGSGVATGAPVRLVVATEVTQLPGGVEDLLSCPAADHVAFGGPRVVVLPAGEAFIRGNTSGIRPTDDLAPVTGDRSESLWSVVRGGETVAIVDDGTLDGVACAGSGVGAA